MMPDDVGIPLLGYRALPGWGYALFTQFQDCCTYLYYGPSQARHSGPG